MVQKLKTLLIVESPSKVKTIGSFFKKEENVEVTSTYGHLRSLPSKKDSIDFKNGINFHWILNKPAIVKNLLKMIIENNEIILATDCDREGEAIAWHVVQLMNQEKITGKIINRIAFQEITPVSIRNALENKRSININLVDAYLARLTEDYTCGFLITEILWKKLRPGYSSAGRVQSPTLEFVRSREQSIREFISKLFYSIEANFNAQDNTVTIDDVDLTLWQGKKIDNNTINSEEEAKEIIDLLHKNHYKIAKTEIKKTKSKKLDPLKTSTLQQLANSRLNFDIKKTMSVAQSLYEGVNVKDKITGLISYMRTDSTFLNEEFVKDAQKYIEKEYGKNYVNDEKMTYKKNKNAQEAHEAIRPTNVEYHPNVIKDYLTKEQHSLYNLIWNSTVGSLMMPAEYANLNIIIENQDEQIQWKKTFKSLIFDGNLILDPKKIVVPNYNLEDLKKSFKVNNEFLLVKCQATDHKTMAPPRYNPGSLVHEMELGNIGRPSTYVSTLNSLNTYKYFQQQQNAFILTPKGAIVSLFLQEYFPKFLQSQSTTLMENDLDAIAQGEKSWTAIIDIFIKTLNDNIKETTEITTQRILETLGPKIFKTFNIENKCPKCSNNNLVLAVKINLFFKCTNCNHNVPLDGLLQENIEEHVENYTIKNSLYGVCAVNNDDKKSVILPDFIDYKTLTKDDLDWFHSLPLDLGDNLFLKLGKYGLYLDKDDIKIAIQEKNLEILKNISKSEWLNHWLSKKTTKSFKSTKK